MEIRNEKALQPPSVAAVVISKRIAPIDERLNFIFICGNYHAVGSWSHDNDNNMIFIAKNGK
jgi:hypothetical protein